MRAFLIVGLVCVAGVATAAPKQKVAILGLEVITASGLPDKDTVRVAQDFTVAVRARVKAGLGPWQYAVGGEHDLVDQKLLNNCESEAPACMAVIGANLGTDFLIYGKVEKKSGFYQVSLKLFEVATKKMQLGIVDSIPVGDAKDVKLQEFAKRLFGKLQGPQAPASAPTTTSTPTTTPPASTAKASCDVAPLTKTADDQYMMGNFGAALVGYEKAIACNSSMQLLLKAFVASCNAKNMQKAKFYWLKLPADKRQSYAQVCMRQSIDPRDM